jgi:solute carrier family 25 citrate transporter 1
LLSGAASGLLARFFTHPLDTVKARLQVQSALNTGALRALPLPYKSTADALSKLAAQEGLAGFYRGFSAVAAAAPLASGVYFGGYELTKRLLMAGDAEREVALPPAAVYMASGVAAQACAGLIYTPMDVVKERMQVQAMLQQQRGSAGRALPVLFASSAACFAAILRAEGPRGAWRGYWAANAAWWPWNMCVSC